MRFGKILMGLAVLAVPGAAHAGLNLVQNGEFEQHSGTITQNTEFGASYSGVGQGVTGWTSANANGYNLYWFGGTETSVSANSRWGGDQRLDANVTDRPGGGNFVSMDGDSSVAGALTQVINGLTAGEQYQLSFVWGAAQLTNRSGPTTEQLQVGLGGSTQYTRVVSNPNQGFSGWLTQTMQFYATGPSETLSFLSIGTPNGQPPMALLDGVSLVDVPEPASLALIAAGVGAISLVRRRRRRG